MRTPWMILPFCLVLMGVSPCDLLESPDDTDSGAPDSTDSAADCDEPCVSELRVDIVRSDNLSFNDGVYGIAVSMPQVGELAIECWLWSAVPEQPLECTYTGPVQPAVGLLEGMTTLTVALPLAPVSSTWVVTYSGGEVGRKDLAPAYELKNENCQAGCVEADEVMAVEIW